MDSDRRQADVIVIGGGIHGCSAALELARRGLSVILIEKDYVARHASGVNAGGVRRLGRDVAELSLSHLAWELWQDMPSLVGDRCGFEVSGQVKVARSDQELDAARQRVATLKGLGFEHEVIVDSETVRELLPASSPDCIGAIYVAGDGHAQPFRTTVAFATRARALGVDILEGTKAGWIARRNGNWHIETGRGVFEAPTIVNAAGAWAGEVSGQLGETIPLVAHAPMLAISNRLPPFVKPVVGALGSPLSFKQFENGTVLIGGGVRGTAYPDENRTSLDFAGMRSFLNTARSIFPIMSEASIVRSWAGIEAYTPDNVPVVGSGREAGVFHSFGYSAHGFQLGPASGRVIAEMVMGEALSASIDGLAPSRFSEVV